MALGGLVKDEIHEKYMAILKRNKRTLTDDLTAFELETIRNHETGNDQFKIDQWIDEKDMQAVPAFFTDNKKIRGYYVGQSDEELNKIEVKLQEYAAVLKKARMIKENSFDGKGHDENGNLINYP